jgi:hypothetical protein
VIEELQHLLDGMLQIRVPSASVEHASRRVLVEVVPCAECPAGPPEDQDADVIVRGRLVERVRHRADELLVEGVQGLGAVHGESPNRAEVIDQQDRFAHIVSLRQIARMLAESRPRNLRAHALVSPLGSGRPPAVLRVPQRLG